MAAERKTVIQLFFPIYFETIFYMLAGIVDTLMLSTISDQAVGAVGTSNTYISMFILLLSIVSIGMMAVMTQNIGAGNDGIAYQAKTIGLIFNIIIGLLISLYLFFRADNLLMLIGIAKDLEKPASTYIRIVGSGCIFNALIPIYAGYLRAFGHAKYPLFATIIGNVINLGLNSLFLFVFHFGIAGVACSTVISKIVNLVIVIVACRIKINAKENPSRAPIKTLIKQIFRVGFPAAFESLLYTIAITFAIRCLNMMDEEGFYVSARSYTAQIAQLTFAVGSALAQANAIMVGWQTGLHEYEKSKVGTRKVWLFGILFAAVLGCIIALLSPYIMRIFSDDPEMIRLVTRLLWIDVILEIGRVTNLIYGQALKTCGDAVFPVVLAVIFMFLCIGVGTYTLGIHFNLMAVGCYIALACDECLRGVGMSLRWKSNKWQKKSLV